MSYISKSKKMNFKQGERVKILRTAETYENGWINDWNNDMDGAVGKIGTIVDPNPNVGTGVRVGVRGTLFDYNYPYFVLQRVKITNEERVRKRMEELNA